MKKKCYNITKETAKNRTKIKNTYKNKHFEAVVKSTDVEERWMSNENCDGV